MGFMRLKRSLSKADSTKVDTLVSAEAYFQGVMAVKGSIRVDGRMEGSMSEAQVVVIGESGEVKGDISADLVIVGGKVTGNIEAAHQIQLLVGSSVHGDLSTPRLIIEDGAVFDGGCKMEQMRSETPSGEETESQPDTG